MAGLTDIQRYVAAQLARSEMVKTSLSATAFLDKLYKSRKKMGGSDQYVPIRVSGVTTAKVFTPDAASDYLGTANGALNEYTNVDPIRQAKFMPSHAVAEMKLSGVQLQKYKKAKHQLSDYMNTRIEFTSDNLKQLVAQQVMSGRGNGQDSTLPSVSGSVSTEFYGLRYQQRRYSGTANTVTAGGTVDNLHLGLERHDFPELVGNEYDATAYGTTVSDTVTLTDGSPTVTDCASTDFSPYIGWEVWYRTTGSSDAWVKLSVIGTAVASAQTSFQLANTFRGTTSSNGYDIEIRAPFNTTDHGASGSFSLAKLYKVYNLASDGNERPDFGLCRTDTFNGFQRYIAEIQRGVLGENKTMAENGWANFMFQGASVIVDNFEQSGTIRFTNSKYCALYALDGMDDLQVNPSSIVELPQQGIKNYGGSAVFVGQLIDAAPNRSAVLYNLDV